MHLIKQEILSEQLLRSLGQKINLNFVAFGEEKALIENLRLIGFNDIPELLNRTFSFFFYKLNIEKFSLSEIEKIDFKEIAYEFIASIDIEKPQFKSNEEKLLAINIYAKIGRIFLHEILFPSLLECDEHYLPVVHQILNKTIQRICIVENLNQNQIFSLLSLDSVQINRPIGFKANSRISTKKLEQKRIEYLVCNLSIKQFDTFYTLISSQYNITSSKRSVVYEIFNSQGKEDIEMIEIPSSKIKVFIRLIFLMKEGKVNGKNILDMSKGKGIWNFIYENVIDSETKTLFSFSFTRVSSEMNTHSNRYSKELNEAQGIFNELLK